MSQEAVHAFGKVLAQSVRDEAIRSCDGALAVGKSAMAQRWREAGASPELLKMVIPDVVDKALCAMLRAIDQEMLPLLYQGDEGPPVELSEAGEGMLVGVYMDDWRPGFSQERFINDLPGR